LLEEGDRGEGEREREREILHTQKSIDQYFSAQG
jgi:hypothetical protein